MKCSPVNFTIPNVRWTEHLAVLDSVVIIIAVLHCTEDRADMASDRMDLPYISAGVALLRPVVAEHKQLQIASVACCSGEW